MSNNFESFTSGGEGETTKERKKTFRNRGRVVMEAVTIGEKIARKEAETQELGDEEVKIKAEIEAEEAKLEALKAEADVEETKIDRLIRKAGQNAAFKKVVAGVILTAGIVGAVHLGHNTIDEVQKFVPNQKATAVEQIIEDASEDVVSLAEQVKQNEKIGIYDGYNEAGMWMSENKGGTYRFADGREVSKICNNNPVEMIKYTARNQSESFADYLANLLKSQPEEFKGLNILETETKLENLSDEEYENIQKAFEDVMDKAFIRKVILNGDYENALMRLKNSSGQVNHKNMELVKCVTQENNVEAIQFYWLDEDGYEIDTMTVKITPTHEEKSNINSDEEIAEFEGCLQVVNEKGSPAYEGLEIVEDEDTPGPETTETTETTDTTDETTGTTDETTNKTTETIIEQKDVENAERNIKQANENIAKDTNTERIVASSTSSEYAKSHSKTGKSSGNDYQGTATEKAQNKNSEYAKDTTVANSGNNYSKNRGDANAGNATKNPVKDNHEAQQATDKARIPNEKLSTSGQELEDALGDLGL